MTPQEIADKHNLHLVKTRPDTDLERSTGILLLQVVSGMSELESGEKVF